MNAKEAVKTALQSTQHILNMYLSDLADEDLLVRPVPNANHIAWQLGHLISSEVRMGGVTPGAAYPELPAGFAEQHGKTSAASDPPRGFRTKKDYLDLFNKVRGATLANLERMPDADLDKPTPGEMAKFAPTVGALFVLTANHTMMHAGQFTVVRRKLGKPVLF
ncbi:MAG: DinB family protein [Planctomycetes bacterium]|nr:DinB family protein [Planctomycetota bacterium]